MEIDKRDFFNDQWKMLQEEKYLIRNMIQTTTEKIELTGFLILGKIKLGNLKNVHFEKKSPKS